MYIQYIFATNQIFIKTCYLLWTLMTELAEIDTYDKMMNQYYNIFNLKEVTRCRFMIVLCNAETL